MTKEEALKLVGNRAEWELKAMKKALSMIQFFNTDEENKRLKAVKILLKK